MSHTPNRPIALSIILKIALRIILVLSFVGCQPALPAGSGSRPSTGRPPPRAATTAVSATNLSLHLLIEVQGLLTRKRPGWTAALPLTFATALDRDDLVAAAPGASGQVVCADLQTVATIPSGYLGAVPCPQTTPLLKWRAASLVVRPLRGGADLAKLPYVIAPRHTRLQTTQPLLRWHASMSGPAQYHLRVWGEGVEWRTTTTTSELRYPVDAPPLAPGGPYYLTVVDGNGRSSAEENSPLDMSFWLLAPQQAITVTTMVDQAHRLDLTEPTTQLLEAEIFAAQGLHAEAVTRLEALLAVQAAPSIYHRLADLQLTVGLYREAQQHYEQAAAQYAALGDLAGEAAARVGVACTLRGLGQESAAKTVLVAAQQRYTELGDVTAAATVTEQLGGKPCELTG